MLIMLSENPEDILFMKGALPCPETQKHSQNKMTHLNMKSMNQGTILTLTKWYHLSQKL